MALTWALIFLLWYLCEPGKLWTRTSYLTSLCLRVLSVKQEQWHLVELGWDSLSQLLSVGPWRTARLRGRRALLLLDASLVSSTCPSPPFLPAWSWPGFLTLRPQCTPTVASQCSLEFPQCLQCQLHQSSPLRDTWTHKRHLASKPRILLPWGSSYIRGLSVSHQAVLQAPSLNNSILLSEVSCFLKSLPRIAQFSLWAFSIA